MTPGTTFWRLVAHHDDREAALRSMLAKGRLAIGWGDIGDLKATPPLSSDEIKTRIEVSYPGATNGVQGAHSLWNLLQMKAGDQVFVSGPGNSRLLVEVTGDYAWVGADDAFTDYQHTRPARLIEANANGLWYERNFHAAKGAQRRAALIKVVERYVERTADPKYGTIQCWCEVTGRPDIGADLKCPTEDEAGQEYWSYSLIQQIQPGDIVFHYSTRDRAFVGASVAGGPVESRPIIWAARGTSARAHKRDPKLRPGWWRPLYGFKPLAPSLALADLEDPDRFGWIKQFAADQKNAAEASFMPFQVRSDGLRAGQGYLFKMPWQVVERFEVLAAGADALTQETERVVVATAPEMTPGAITSAGTFKLKSASNYAAVVTAKQQIRTRTHESIVRVTAEYLQSRGIALTTPHPIDLQAESLPKVIFEMKVAVAGATLYAIRAAVGQLFEYRHFLGPADADLCIVLSEEPTPAEIEYCESRLQLSLAWWASGAIHGGPRWQALVKRLTV